MSHCSLRRSTLAALVVVTSILGLVALPGTVPGPVRAAVGVPGPGDWPMYLNNPERTNWSDTETALSPATAPYLRQRWQIDLGSPLATSPTVVGDTVYMGSWDGYEYA